MGCSFHGAERTDGPLAGLPAPVQSQCARGRVSARPPLWERKPLSSRALSPAGERLLPRQDRPRPPIVIETGPDGISLGRKATKPGGGAAPVLGPLPRSRVRVCSVSARCRVTEPRVQPARPPRFSRLSSFCFWNPVSHFFFCTNCVHTDWLVLLQREPGGGQEAGGTGEVEVRADGGGLAPLPATFSEKEL